LEKLSRNSRNIVIVGTAIFIIATVLTLQLEAVSDGWSAFGYPLTFYRYTEGKQISSSSFEFQFVNLFVDYLLALCVSILLIEGVRKIRKQRPA